MEIVNTARKSIKNICLSQEVKVWKYTTILVTRPRTMFEDLI